MKGDQADSQTSPLLEELYPELTAEACAEAEGTLTRYAALLVRMVERRAAEREWTDGERNDTKVKTDRSNPATH